MPVADKEYAQNGIGMISNYSTGMIEIEGVSVLDDAGLLVVGNEFKGIFLLFEDVLLIILGHGHLLIFLVGVNLVGQREIGIIVGVVGIKNILLAYLIIKVGLIHLF